MSISRILLICVLVLMLLGLLGMGGMLVYKQFPHYWMTRAEREIEAENYADAETTLRKLLSKSPKNVDAMLQLVDVIRDGAEKEGRSRSYAANGESVKWLARAAELRPDDLELQKRMLRVYLSIPNQIGKAVPIAKEVAKSEPDNSDAHIALTWEAVEKKDKAKAEKLFGQFENNEIVTRRIFQTLFLQHKFYAETEDTDKAERVLADAAWKAEQLKDEELDVLLYTDRLYMLELLLRYQALAEEPQVALDRGKTLIDTAKRMSRLNLAEKTILANAAASSIALFNHKFPSINLEPAHRVLRNQLSEETRQLGSDALAEADDQEISAPMLVYWNTARTQMNKGDFDEALATLERGIKAAEKLDSRNRGGLLDLHLLAARALISARRYEEADAHLDKLLTNERFEGWSHLLKGSVALHQGRLQLAHDEFIKAKGNLGESLLVQMSLAHTHMAREEWDKAVPLLNKINRPIEQLTDEEKAWFREMLGNGDRVHFDLLRAKLAQGKWQDAQVNLAALKDKDLAPAAWGVVVTYLWEEEKDKEKARKYIDLVRQRYPDDLALALLDARLLNDDGRTVDANKVMEEYAATHSDEISQLAFARWQIRNRQAEKALTTLANVEQMPNLSRKARNTIAVYRVQALIGAQQFEEADRKVDELINNEGTATAGYLMKAALAFRVRDEKLGVEMLEKAQAANPSNPALNMMVQRIKSAKGDIDGVLDLAGSVAGIEKYRTQVQTTVGAALRELAETEGPEAAIAKVDELLHKQPNDLTLIILKVDLLLRLDRADEAMQLLRVAQQNSPDDVNIPRLQAQAWLAQNDPESALKAIAEATALEQKQGIPEGQGSSDLMVLGAQAGLAAEDYETARLYALKLSKKEPDSPRGFLLVAESFKQAGDMPNAIAVLEYFAKRHPNDFAIKKTLAGLYQQNGQVEKALAAMGGSGAKDIRLTAAQIELLLKSNRKEEAQLIAQQAVGSSRNVNELLTVATAFAEAGENIDAQSYGERASMVANQTNKHVVHSFLGRIYLRRASQENSQGFYDKARVQFKLVLETNPRDLVAGNNLAWLLATKFDRPDDAVEIVEKVRGNSKLEQLPPAFIDTMIDCYQRAGLQQKAIALANEAIGFFPNEASLLYRYGVLLSESEPTQAKQMLSRALQLDLSEENAAEAKRILANL